MSREHVKTNNNKVKAIKMNTIENDTNSQYLTEETINSNVKILKLTDDTDDIEESIKSIKINNNINESTKLNKTKNVSKFFNYDNDDYESDDLNPFNKNTDELTNNNIIFEDDDQFQKKNEFSENSITAIIKIEIWVEIRKGKKNTYVYNLGHYMDIETIKAHLKKIRIAKGCNGSITKLLRDTGDIEVLQLQGNHKDYMSKHLILAGIDSDLIYIKGE